MPSLIAEIPSSVSAFEVSDELSRLNAAWRKNARGRKQRAQNIKREKQVGPVRVETLAQRQVRELDQTFRDIGL